MELNHSGMIYFALKEESNQVVHISEMVEKDRGKACECICLCCGRPLVAKLGHGKKTAHFATFQRSRFYHSNILFPLVYQLILLFVGIEPLVHPCP